jgi:metallo-beta-lactamase family protein
MFRGLSRRIAGPVPAWGHGDAPAPGTGAGGPVHPFHEEHTLIDITFLGAVREVTGSMHLIATPNDRILLDCGMFQGKRRQSDAKNRRLDLDPATVTNLVLSHAHIDHSGRIPLLTRQGFKGRVITTRATADACAYLLPDAAHIQEGDAAYLNYKTARHALLRAGGKGSHQKRMAAIKKRLKPEGHRLDTDAIQRLMAEHHLRAVEPLFTVPDADHALSFFDGTPYRHPVTVGRNTTCTLYEAGHILGSAMTAVRIHDNGRQRTIVYTGDIGRFDKPIIRDPAINFEGPDREVDLLVMESTYGNRRHEPQPAMRPALRRILADTHARGGTVIIPSFAFGRTQELLYILHELYDAGEVPRVPVYVDSPLATKITRVFGEHPEVYDRETHQAFLQRGKNPFAFQQVRFVESVEASMALNRDETPHIVIAASGMCEAGRVLHHLRHKIHNPRHTILIVGYMAQHTLGRRILDLGAAYTAAGREGPAPRVRLLNKEYPLRAQVTKLGGFSAHGDREEMLHFLKSANLRIRRIALVHGEEDQSLSFADHLRQAGFEVTVPEPGQSIHVA